MLNTIDFSKLEMVTGGKAKASDICFNPFLAPWTLGCYQGIVPGTGNVTIKQDIHPHAPGENINVGGGSKKKR